MRHTAILSSVTTWKTFGSKVTSASEICWYGCWDFLFRISLFGAEYQGPHAGREGLSGLQAILWSAKLFQLCHADGIFNLLYPDKTALRGINKPRIDDFQLCLDLG